MTAQGTGAAAPLRRALLLVAGIALLAGLASGLMRLGVLPGVGRLAAVHGPVMVLGTVGTLIALERAVGVGRPWAYLAPGAAALGAVALVAGAPPVVGTTLLGVAGVALVGVFAHLLRLRPAAHTAVMGVGAALWPAAVVVWAATGSVPRSVGLLAGFLVLTVVGERLELSRLSAPSPAARRRLAVAIGVLVAGLAAWVVVPAAGARIAGVGLLAQALWLLRHDLAPRLARRPGVVGFAGATLTVGYGWLGVGGALWALTGVGAGGPAYDAALHAVFLGFAMSMVFGHAPLILPAVLRLDVPFSPALYAPVALLSVTLAARLLGDLTGVPALVTWGGVGNVVAVLGFFATVGLTRAAAVLPPLPLPARRHA